MTTMTKKHTRTVTIPAFTFDELDDRAKDRVREWLREGDTDWYEFVFARYVRDERVPVRRNGETRLKLTKKQMALAIRLTIEHGVGTVARCPICGKIAADPAWPDIATRCKRKGCVDEDAVTLNLDLLS